MLVFPQTSSEVPIKFQTLRPFFLFRDTFFSPSKLVASCSRASRSSFSFDAFFAAILHFVTCATLVAPVYSWPHGHLNVQ